ncbi:hypothetical protein A7982_12683 [Minicystis rosea]|nr:hypothetical protein A7982_12683 [Minicystis rosea]
MDVRVTPPADWIDVPLTNVLTLAATAVAHTRYPWLGFRDPLAEAVWLELGACEGELEDRALRAALGRTLQLDDFARAWTHETPRGRVVEVGAGLSTRHARLTGLASPILSVDEAPLAEIRRAVFPTHHTFTQVTAPLEQRSWMRRAAAPREALFVVVEDAFLDLDTGDVLTTLASLAAELPPGSRLAVSHGPRARFAVANPGARRATLEVHAEHESGERQVARFPRFTWVTPPSTGEDEPGPEVALLEAA